MSGSLDKLKLQGFNNLTKTLGFNLYAVCYTGNEEQRSAYNQHISEVYSAGELTRILRDVAGIVGATILHVACQDYEPQGASATLMIAEEPMLAGTQAPLPESVVAHLDKSHITAHTYPESDPEVGINTLRVDIDISTCGLVSPLKALNHLIDIFSPAILTLDYRVRGFTRDVQGRKHFIDHEISSIQSHLSRDSRRRYRTEDTNLQRENIFHTRMMLKAPQLGDHLFGVVKDALPREEQARIDRLVRREMEEIFHGGRNTQPPDTSGQDQSQ
jgi:S-adenosylmethionine decarboxylase